MLNLLTPYIRTYRLLKLGQSPQYNFISTFPLFLSQKIFSHQFFMGVSLVHCYMVWTFLCEMFILYKLDQTPGEMEIPL